MNKQLSLILSAAFLAVGLPHAAKAIIIDAQVSSVTGKAYVLQPGSTARLELRPGMTLAPGSTVSTETGSVGLQLMPGAVTILQPSTELAINRLDYEKKSDNTVRRSVLLDLKKGSVLSNLQKTGASDFRIKTPYGVAAARGTTWETSTGKVTVYESMVEVTLNSGRRITIQAGTFVEIVNGDAGNAAPITQQEYDDMVQALKEAGFNVTVESLPNGGGSKVSIVPPGSDKKFNGTFNPSNLTGGNTSPTEPSNQTPSPTPTQPPFL